LHARTIAPSPRAARPGVKKQPDRYRRVTTIREARDSAVAIWRAAADEPCEIGCAHRWFAACWESTPMSQPPPPRRRVARPLLVGGAAAVALSIGVAACGDIGPFGNLKPPNCDLGQCGPPEDLSVPIDSDGPFGNLKPPIDFGESD
jgi:hypothetical protein